MVVSSYVARTSRRGRSPYLVWFMCVQGRTRVAGASTEFVRVRGMTQRTLVLLKPDTVRRGLVGEVLGRFEARGLTIVALEHRSIDGEMADQHYAEHVERDFSPPLRAFATSGPL